MAWVTSGTVIEKATTEWKTDTALNNIQTTNAIITCDDTCCLAMVRDSLVNGVKTYKINVVMPRISSL